MKANLSLWRRDGSTTTFTGDSDYDYKVAVILPRKVWEEMGSPLEVAVDVNPDHGT